MTYLTTANTSLGLGLSRGERREVIVEDELLGLLYENLVHLLFVHLCSERDGGKRLCLTTGEYGRAVSARQTVNLAPDRTYLCGLTTVHTKALVEDKIPQSLSLFVTEISLISIFLASCSSSVRPRDSTHSFLMASNPSLSRA